MLDELIQVKREYEDAKEKAIEKSVDVLEKRTAPWFFVLFFALTIHIWAFAIFIVQGFEILFNAMGLYPLAVFFVISYFTLFLGSKSLFKPSHEELTDDTSKFAMFSACGRRVKRSWISIVLSVFHTLFFTLYLIDKDLKFL